MLMAGVHALASLSPALHNPEASLLPDLADVRKVSVEVAAAVVRQAVEDGNATDQETIDVVQGKASQGLEDYIRVRSCFEDSRRCGRYTDVCRAVCGTQFTGHSSWSTRYRYLVLFSAILIWHESPIDSLTVRALRLVTRAQVYIVASISPAVVQYQITSSPITSFVPDILLK
jgi:hypothetical protein